MRSSGLHVSLADVSRLTRPSERAYMTAQAIVNFAPQVGMEARLYTGGSLHTVRQAIRARVPLIVLQSHITPSQVIPTGASWSVTTTPGTRCT